MNRVGTALRPLPLLAALSLLAPGASHGSPSPSKVDANKRAERERQINLARAEVYNADTEVRKRNAKVEWIKGLRSLDTELASCRAKRDRLEAQRNASADHLIAEEKILANSTGPAHARAQQAVDVFRQDLNRQGPLAYQAHLKCQETERRAKDRQRELSEAQRWLTSARNKLASMRTRLERLKAEH